MALEAGDVALVLPFVPADGEAEVRGVFDRVRSVREFGSDAREVADRLFSRPSFGSIVPEKVLRIRV
jgi:hypothetical protein